jgi:hypothetical protein
MDQEESINAEIFTLKLRETKLKSQKRKIEEQHINLNSDIQLKERGIPQKVQRQYGQIGKEEIGTD